MQRVGTTPGSLYRAELFQRKNGRHIERQGFDVIDRKRGPVGIREPVQIRNERPGNVPDDSFAVTPDEAGNARKVLHVVQVIRQEFFALADSHAVDVRTIVENPIRVHRGKNPADNDRDVLALGLEQPGHAFCRRVGGRGQKRDGNDVRRVFPECLCDVRLLHLRVAGVEHPDLVAVLSQNGCKRLDAQRRESHHLDPLLARLRSAHLLRQQPVEILVVHENEEYFQNDWPFWTVNS